MSKLFLLFILIVVIGMSGLTILPEINDSRSESSTSSKKEIALNQNNNLDKPANIEITDLGIMKASWYGPRFHGRHTANGEIYDQMGLTAAHKSFSFDTLLRLTNPYTKTSVIVRINDRGPYIPGRQLDLSKKVAMILGIYKKGVANIKVEKISVKGVDSPVLN